MDNLAFHDVYTHMANYTLQGTKMGYFAGQKDMQVILIKGTRGADPKAEGRWLVSLNGEVSYVSPSLYDLLLSYTSMEIAGQTLTDGTVMSVSRIHTIVNNSLPICSEDNTPRRARVAKVKRETDGNSKVDSKKRKCKTRAVIGDPDINELRKKDVAVVGYLRDPKKVHNMPISKTRTTEKNPVHTDRTDDMREAYERVCKDNDKNFKNVVVKFI
jgi:hypothetical protein